MKNILCFLAILLFSFPVNAQSASERAAVSVNASVQASPASITLSWKPIGGTSSFAIYRKLKTATTWGSAIANPSSSATQYVDNAVTVGTNYEYKIVRVSGGVTGTGYINCGIQVPSVDYRGKIILLVDNSMSAQIIPELTQLIYDLRADGWGVLVSYVSPSASVSSVKNEVIAQYNTDPANVKALYIIGHVPVPYSGNTMPDGHTEFFGAKPTDGYYAELNGVWTDNTVNNTSANRQENHNVPGDGKFDQNNFPTSVELQVGRVDMYDMPAFSASEVQLIRNYLNKAHGFKTKAWTPMARALQFDNLQWVSDPLAAGGWRNLAPLVGNSNITELPPYQASFGSMVNNQSYLWTNCSAGGLLDFQNNTWLFIGQDNAAITSELATTINMGGVFNMGLGSYYGDFDNKNNYLRALIARGDALTNCWSGIPTWYFHHMGMGDNIGYSTWITMNNTSLYTPLTEGWQSSIGKTHINLMGDPSLRMKMVDPPTGLTISNSGGNILFNWTASTGVVQGYHIYQFAANGTITRITSAPVVGTTWTSSTSYLPNVDYMVRAIKLENGPSGSYDNLSLGAIATSPQSQQMVKLDAKVFLEGPFNGTVMGDSLRTNGQLPLSTPYTSMGYVQTNNLRNESVPQSIMNTTGNAAIIDWIIVELRTQPNTIFASRTGLLRKDGKIVDMDGVSPLEFAIQSGSYYIVVKHRNHLAIMTLGQVTLSSTPTTVDFTSGTLPIYGTDAMEQVNGRSCMWAGDVNFDGTLKYTGTNNDRDPILSAIGGSVSTNIAIGYHPEDINMDGKVMYTGARNDRDIILSNIGGILATNTKTQQLP